MKDFLYRFFQGRYGAYGTDRLTKWCLSLAVILLVLSFLTPLGFLYYIAFLLLFYCYFRLFSRNIPGRYKENEVFVKNSDRFVNFFKSIPKKLEQLRTFVVYRCPNCNQKIRVPRGKGKIEISCPKCGSKFIKKS